MIALFIAFSLGFGAGYLSHDKIEELTQDEHYEHVDEYEKW